MQESCSSLLQPFANLHIRRNTCTVVRTSFFDSKQAANKKSDTNGRETLEIWMFYNHLAKLLFLLFFVFLYNFILKWLMQQIHRIFSHPNVKSRSLVFHLRFSSNEIFIVMSCVTLRFRIDGGFPNSNEKLRNSVLSYYLESKLVLLFFLIVNIYSKKEDK